MKINKLLLLFALPLSLISCGNSISVTKEEKNNIIDKLIDNVYVEAHAYQDLIYPKEYASYSSKSEYHFQRQYSTFMDNNKEIEAVRFIKGSKTVTYFEGSTGKAYYQVFDQNGNIKNIDLIAANTTVNFAKTYANPFSFIDTIDIKDNLSLDTAKANFIIKSFLDIQVSASKAKFIYENDIVTGLDVEVSDKNIVLELYTGEQITSTLKTNIEISFNYDVEKINFLTANSEADTEIVNALNKLKTNNYTIDIFSDNLESDARLFVTNDIVYHHKDKEYEGMSDGDTLYVKNLDNTYYTKYIYSKSDNDFIKMSASATLDSFIPGFNKIKANLFNKISTNQYVFNYAEAKLNAELLLAPNYNFFPGNNQKASITLVDGEIRNISVLAESSSIVVINENIYNQGNTTIPSWIDLSLIA